MWLGFWGEGGKGQCTYRELHYKYREAKPNSNCEAALVIPTSGTLSVTPLTSTKAMSEQRKMLHRRKISIGTEKRSPLLFHSIYVNRCDVKKDLAEGTPSACAPPPLPPPYLAGDRLQLMSDIIINIIIIFTTTTLSARSYPTPSPLPRHAGPRILELAPWTPSNISTCACAAIHLFPHR